MTVINTAYSSIDEAWADSYLTPSLQKPKSSKKSKNNKQPALPPMTDPICDLYEMGGHDDADLVRFANSYYETHEKSKYQKPRMLEREPQPKVVEIDVPADLSFGSPVRAAKPPPPPPQKTEYDDDSDEEQDQEMEPSIKRQPIYYDSKEPYQDDDSDWTKKNREFNHFDLALYIISGIILIFMMEQFVKLGAMMRGS